MTKLVEVRGVKERFARSINLERDVASDALSGYLPVGRALESLDRLALAMTGSSESALSVTGPYGSGKSSLALLMDAAFAPARSKEFKTAKALLEESSPTTWDNVERARRDTGASQSGFVRAVVTARREPVAVTILRALHVGVSTFFASKHSKESTRLLGDLASDLHLAGHDRRPDVAVVRSYVRRLSALAPALIVIDEFGKNLEAFAESPGDGDLFLLQELAEWTKPTGSHRVALVTLQHMAFGDYANTTSAAQRREWVKIQGRFEDIPFVDTPEQTRTLIASTFTPIKTDERRRVSHWVETQKQQLKKVGLADLAAEPEQLEKCWPLHPLALAVLPELCHRYGQNERTIFSFLASNEPKSVQRYLAATDLPAEDDDLPSVGLEHVYDYFVESAGTMVGVSTDASRWIEIDTRIRDTRGLNDLEVSVLKVVGLLNLVSTGGTLRASQSMLRYALGGDAKTLQRAIDKLATAGVITYRDFADEFRVWQGSDVDIRAALDTARRRLRDTAPDAIMRRALALPPVVAARHSHESGTLRFLDQTWASLRGSELPVLTADDRADGLLIFLLGEEEMEPPRPSSWNSKPIIWVRSNTTEHLLTAAIELLAIEEALHADESVQSDWVARRELNERRVLAGLELRKEFLSAFSAGNCIYTWWEWQSRRKVILQSAREASPSIIASRVCDSSYSHAIPLWNELVNRHELTSQAAKARREVAEVMQQGQSLEMLGLTGGGPDVTLYRSLFERFGIHTRQGATHVFTTPPYPAKHVWQCLVATLESATESRVNVADVYRTLSLPPYGLRGGVAPLLLLAALLAQSDQLALYEHGTFRPRLAADVTERLLRNPANFEVKCFAAASGSRAAFLQKLAASLELPSAANRNPSVVGVVGRMVAEMNMLPDYSKRTSRISAPAAGIRRVMQSATEPDRLLFEDVPTALGDTPVSPSASVQWGRLGELAEKVADALVELRAAYPALLAEIRQLLASNLRADEASLRQSLAGRAIELKERVIDQRLRALVSALQADLGDDESWLENVGMQVTGVPPRGWSDEDRRRFELLLVDLGGSFRRVEALHADVRAGSGEFDAIRVAINSTAGSDAVRLFQLDDARRELADRIIRDLTLELQHGEASDDDALTWLLARLLERELGESAEDVGGAGYGDEQKGVAS